MIELEVVSRPLGASALARLALDGGAPAGWYPSSPRSWAGWRAHALRVRGEYAGRDWVAGLWPALSPSGLAAERLRRVVEGGGVVVTTGQQPGLFGGPIYTWGKALSALAVADLLEGAIGVPVAPVFWAATYDSDFTEASVSYVALGATVERLAMAPPAVTGRGMRETPLGDVRPLLAILERAAGSAADPAVLDMVRSAYAPGHTVGSAFVALTRSILEPLGVAVLDAGHEVVRRAARPLLNRALADAEAIDAALRRREEELRQHGHEPQVAHVRGLSLVFETAPGERKRIPISAAADLARRNADRELEPNVLLRPVVERAILPTVAYVGGPAEIAYFAQASAVAAALGAPLAVVLPRWSGVIVEPHVRRILDRYGLDVDDLRDPHAALNRLVRERVPSEVRAALTAYRTALDQASASLERAVTAASPPLVPQAVLDGARNAIGHRLDRLERRIVSAIKRREEELGRGIATARASLFPLDRPQERVLNLMPMLARHGPRLLDLLVDAARAHARGLLAAERSEAAVAAHDRTGGHG